MQNNFQQKAEAIFGEINWQDEHTGFLECPGKELHTKPNGARDCKIFIDGAPSLTCFHQSCSAILIEANLALRQALVDDQTQVEQTEEEYQAARAKLHEKRLQHKSLYDKTRQIQPTLSTDWKWEEPFTELLYPELDFERFFRLFEKDDVIWIGHKFSSGSPEHARHFQTVEYWYHNRPSHYQFTCPSTFYPGTYSRSNLNVKHTPYLVVESDVLDKTEILAVFNWCRQFMDLKVVVDTGGKSLHGWFRRPDDEVVHELAIMLPVFGCDKAMFKPSQPCRLPGVRRAGDIYQRIVWCS